MDPNDSQVDSLWPPYLLKLAYRGSWHFAREKAVGYTWEKD